MTTLEQGYNYQQTELPNTPWGEEAEAMAASEAAVEIVETPEAAEAREAEERRKQNELKVKQWMKQRFEDITGRAKEADIAATSPQILYSGVRTSIDIDTAKQYGVVGPTESWQQDPFKRNI